MNTIGAKIKKLREMKEFKQEYMAEKLGITPAGYGKIERDETDVSFSRLVQISNVLEIPVNELISFDEKMTFFFNTISGGNNGVVYQNIANSFEKEKLELENSFLKNENEQLKKIIALLENRTSN